MTNVTQKYQEMFLAYKALVVFRMPEDDTKMYVESYDMDRNGRPCNAHPLTKQECIELADRLQSTQALNTSFLRSRSILSQNILFVDPSPNGYAIWYTPSMQVNMLFVKNLNIPSGQVNVPPMVWKANKNDLWVYALKEDKRPDTTTPLFHAPYFNIHDDGKVCMGTVDIELDDRCSLEKFIEQWQSYFFNSYFSHLLIETSPVQMNIVELWTNQRATQSPFPFEVLKKFGNTLKHLLHEND